MTKKKKQIQSALAELNKVVWSNPTSDDFQDGVRAICAICVACKLDVNSVLTPVEAPVKPAAKTSTPKATAKPKAAATK